MTTSPTSAILALFSSCSVQLTACDIINFFSCESNESSSGCYNMGSNKGSSKETSVSDENIETNGIK